MRLIQPLVDAGVRHLARLGVNPLHVVLGHAALGFLAAWLIAQGSWGQLLAAAALLQLKTLLDNIDGGLARATSQVTLMGRYLDTGMDLLSNAALFLALARHGPTLSAALAFILLTFILGLDYNLERLYREQRQATTGNPVGEVPPVGAPTIPYRFFKGLYTLLLTPQDRLITRLEHWRFRRLCGQAYRSAPTELRQAWSDLFSSASLVNLGLSSQLFLLGLLLALDRPYLYILAVFLQGGYVLGVQLLRVARFRRYLAGTAREIP